MKHFLNIFCLLITIVFFHSIQAQQLIHSEHLGDRSKAQVEAELFNTVNVNHGVKLYKILYTTLDVHEVLDTASGLLVLPNVEGQFPLLCSQHGTIGDKMEVPSRLSGGYQLGLVTGGFSYITAMPDYLGLGDSRGFHPYLHAETEASVAIDMLIAVREFLEGMEGISLNEQLFITGYSQGGHAALALHKELELNHSDEFNIVASAPMSGPYDMSGTIIDFGFEEQEYFFVGYVPYILLSYQEVYGNLFDEVEDYFKQPYATEIERFFNHEITLNELNELAIEQLMLDHGASIPVKMMQDSVLENLQNHSGHPIRVAFQKNDLHDWAPQVPTRLYYCRADDQVPFMNSLVADSIMNVNGAFDLDAFDVGSNLDHGQCVLPAMASTLFFFSNFQDFMTNTENFFDDNTSMQLFPNPTDEWVRLDFSTQKMTVYGIEILDINGKNRLTYPAMTVEAVDIDVQHLSSGIYFMRVFTSHGIHNKKLIIN